MRPIGRLRRHLRPCVAAACLCGIASTAYAAELTPTTRDDVPQPDDGLSLRQAVQRAAQNPGYDAITLAPGRYALTDCGAGALTVPDGDSLTVFGNGATVVQTCPGAPAFSVSGVGYLRAVTVTSASETPAPLVYTDGLLWTRSAVMAGSPGAGIRCVGCSEVVVINSRLQGNAAGGLVVRGGARRVFVSVRGSQVLDNRSDFSGAGVSVTSASPASHVWITDSTVAGNAMVGDLGGGGVSIAGPRADVLRSFIRGNVAGSEDTPGSGGGLRFAATDDRVLTIAGSVISGNRASMAGGGLLATGPADVSISASTIADNRAAAQGGGGAVQTTASGGLVVDGSTITRNTAGPASGGGGLSVVGSSRRVTISRSTVEGNTAGRGGGVDAADAVGVAVERSTVVRNTSPRGANLAVSGDAGLTLLADLIAQPQGGANCSTGPGGSVASNGFSFLADASCGRSPGDVVDGSDPGVGPVGAPAGLVPPMAALRADSPAAGIVPVEVCAGLTDQAGRPRGADGCAAGASEPADSAR